MPVPLQKNDVVELIKNGDTAVSWCLLSYLYDINSKISDTHTASAKTGEYMDKPKVESGRELHGQGRDYYGREIRGQKILQKEINGDEKKYTRTDHNSNKTSDAEINSIRCLEFKVQGPSNLTYVKKSRTTKNKVKSENVNLNSVDSDRNYDNHDNTDKKLNVQNKIIFSPLLGLRDRILCGGTNRNEGLSESKNEIETYS